MSETQHGTGTFDGNPDAAAPAVGEGTTTPVSETAEQGTPAADKTDVTDQPETGADEVTAGEESAAASEDDKPVWDVSTHGPAPSGSDHKYRIINAGDGDGVQAGVAETDEEGDDSEES